jgi:hypothetical protein
MEDRVDEAAEAAEADGATHTQSSER